MFVAFIDFPTPSPHEFPLYLSTRMKSSSGSREESHKTMTMEKRITEPMMRIGRWTAKKES
jgi:hypothetical protein